MKNKIILIMLLSTTFFYSQSSKLIIFENLVNKTWKAEGKWGDDSKFKQISTFEFALDSSIVIVKSEGYVDQKQEKFGMRNHGIRKYDKETNTILFWEFDVFGGLTKGELILEGKNMYYNYKYGNSIITDAWLWVNENEYNFKVGTYENGEWVQVYLETKFYSNKNEKYKNRN
ncbi:hypothetical protein [Psychroserpens algicola]|uniref:DUF1579 domain-containing protein n=1 Tax=Psychroserpens algicola TaxID=1719034 RepID=A0ABT0H7I6_9FLAO|nr:hypothetical protein [Psychroserpens algicola]MCK8479812.1 hypothetical protein [Psychroserpens algicola]